MSWKRLDFFWGGQKTSGELFMHVCVCMRVYSIANRNKQIKSNQMILMERLTILQSIVIFNQINAYDDAAANATATTDKTGEDEPEKESDRQTKTGRITYHHINDKCHFFPSYNW